MAKKKIAAGKPLRPSQQHPFCADLLTVARFLIDDGFDLEVSEAARLTLFLAEFAGTIGQAQHQYEQEAA